MAATKRTKKAAIAVIGGLGLVVTLLVVALLMLPRLIGLPSLGNQLAREASRRLGAEVKVHALRLSFWPLPHVTLDRVSLSLPRTIDVTVESVSAFPELLPLVRGKLQLAELRLERPDVRVYRAPPRDDAAVSLDHTSVARFTESVTSALAVLSSMSSSYAPGLVVLVNAGSVELSVGNESALQVTDIHTQIDLPSNRFALALTCRSNLWEQLSGSFSLASDAAMLDAQATQVNVASVRHVVTRIAGEVPLIRDIFSVLQGGTVPEITFRSRASSLDGLAEEQALVIQGRLLDGRIHLPGLDLDFDDVTGDATVADGLLGGTQISAQFGKSRLTAATLRIGLGDEAPDLKVDTHVRADAAEVAGLLARLVKGKVLSEQLHRFTDVAGTLSGQLLLGGTTKDATVTADISALDVSARLPGMKQPLRIGGGRVFYDARGIAATDLQLRATGLALSQLSVRVDWGRTPVLLDAATGNARIVVDEVSPWLAAAGWLPRSPWTSRVPKGTLVLNSLRVSGPALAPADWQFELVGAARNLEIESQWLGQRVTILHPVALSNLRLAHGPVWTSFSAKVPVLNGLSGAVDLAWNADELNIKRLSIRDRESQAWLSLRRTQRELELTFAGNVTRATLEAVAPENPLLPGWLRGDLRARVVTDELTRSTAEGRLEAGDILLPVAGDTPLRVTRVTVDANAGVANVAAAIDAGADDHLQVQGRLTPSPRVFLLDGTLTLDHLSWERLAPLLNRGRGDGEQQATHAWNLPLRGTLRVAAESFTYDSFTWKPLRATVDFGAGGLTAMVTDATVCGIATPGRIAVTPEGLTLAFEPSAKNQELDKVLTCLTGEKTLANGHYSLAGNATARGEPVTLATATQGHAEFTAKDGRIYRMWVLAKVLSLLSLATGSVGNLLDLPKDGLAYDTIKVQSDLRDGALAVRAATLDGPSVKIACSGTVDLLRRTVDLTMLAAPFTAVDAVVSRIPVIGTILGGRLISIPIRVTGALDEPEVIPLSPSAVGSSLMGIMKSTLRLPIRVIQPLLPGGEKP